jgi:hypothetical protein
MPLLWGRIAWFASFAIAIVATLWMRSLSYGWPATLGLAVIIWVVLPFVISQLCAAVVLWRMHRRIRQVDPDGLRDKIADAIKGLPPEEQEAVGKRIIDEAFKRGR